MVLLSNLCLYLTQNLCFIPVIMKYLYLAVFCLFSLLGFSQTKKVAKQIEQMHARNVFFQEIQLFKKSENQSRAVVYQNMVTDVTILDLDTDGLSRIMSNAPNALSVTIPYKNTDIIVELYKSDIFSEGFNIKDNTGRDINYKQGRYYRGIVKNNPNSIVAISFFDDDVAGVSSDLVLGNVVIGKSRNGQDFMSYADYTITGTNPFSCGVDEMPLRENTENIQQTIGSESVSVTENCVRIYYELINEIYTSFDENIEATLNWMTSVHNNISTLYENDDVRITSSEVMVWTEVDPYAVFDDPYDIIENFYMNTQSFNGDLAHLVSVPTTTSLAYLNSLCLPWRHGYSGISIYYQEVPVYSWTIGAMSHEIGHSLGSPHTHDCSWNGDNTAIDGCGYQYNNADGCDAPFPTDGGTIMSYCHLFWSVGINFAHGFDPQPAQLIRQTVDSKWCLNTSCEVLSVDDIVRASTLQVYPNPAQKSLYITSQQDIIESVRLVDITGKAVLFENVNSLTAEVAVDKLPQGVYFMTVSLKDAVVVKKIVKQ